MTLLVHILAGAFGIVAGFVALFAAKGERLHRRSGTVFFYSMVVLSLTGTGIALVRGSEGSVIGGLLAGYLVTTALTTVRPPFAGSRPLALALMAVALAVGVASVTLGVAALGAPSGSRDGIPAVIFFTFGAVALLAAASDARVIRSGALQGARRVARHLWRMCFALYIASGSFFLGQADEIPEPLRITPLLALLAFLPLLVMFYWLWRVRRRQGSGSPLSYRNRISRSEVSKEGAT
jgi:hypothetical protein